MQVSVTDIKMSVNATTSYPWTVLDVSGHDISGHQRHSNGIRPAAQGQGRRMEVLTPQHVTVGYMLTF